jgi:fucose permease
MPAPDDRRVAVLSAAAYSGMFVFGIVMALLGAILPSLAERLRFDAAAIGTLFLVMNGAMLVASLILGLAMDRFGMKPPMLAGPLLVSGALVLIVRSIAFADLLPAVAVLGVGGGALNGATNTLIADLHDDPRRKGAALNRLGIFFGIGALFLPFAIGALLASLSLEALLLVAAALCAAVGVFAAALRFPAPKQRHALPVREMPRFLRSPLVLVFAAMLFFQSGVEFTMGGFVSTYLREVGGFTVGAAAWILAGYWAAIILARIGLSRPAFAADPYRVLRWCASGALAGSLLIAATPAPAVAAAAVVLAGWSLAGVFPTALGIVGARYQTHSGTVFGILFACALTGGMTLPWVAGRIGASIGLRWSFAMIAAAFAAILCLSAVAARLDAPTPPPGKSPRSSTRA